MLPSSFIIFLPGGCRRRDGASAEGARRAVDGPSQPGGGGAGGQRPGAVLHAQHAVDPAALSAEPLSHLVAVGGGPRRALSGGGAGGAAALLFELEPHDVVLPLSEGGEGEMM